MIPFHFLCTDKVHRGVIVGKIIRHGLDFFFDTLFIRAFLKHHKAFSRMLLSGRQIRILSRPDTVQRFLHRDGILPGIGHTFNSADSIGMPLADALPPEGIILSLRKDGVGIQTVQRKHSRIPAAGYDSHFSALFRFRVHSGEMLRYLRMGIKTVYHMEIPCKFRGLYG